MTTKFASEVLSVSDLLTKGRFEVPWHQRYYDWTHDEVKELLADLSEALDEDRDSYFLGSVMLVDAGEVWQINDGQQRMITLSLLVAALCRRFAAGRRRVDAPRELLALRLLFDRPVNAARSLDDTSTDSPRIRPPRQDRMRYAQIVRGHDIGTNGKMVSAWNEIGLFLTGRNPKAAARFFDFVTGKVEVGVLYVPQTEDANAVFEALNGRGKKLDDVDLIRNHLYSYFAATDDRERRSTVHDNLESVVVASRGPRRTNEYFRCYFQCRFGYLQKKRFYRETRAKLRGVAGRSQPGNYVYGLVGELADPRFVELFRTITAPSPSADFLSAFGRASGTTKRKRNLGTFLGELQNYTVTHSLLFALLRKFVESAGRPAQQRKALARALYRGASDLASFVMRVSFCEAKFEPSRFEAAFANCARRIASASSANLRDGADLNIQADLGEGDDRGIMDDARFVPLLAGAAMTDSRRAKRLLFGIARNEDREGRAFHYRGCAVEHVLPQSPIFWKGWAAFADAGSDVRPWVDRIGNLTLVGDSDNFSGTRFNSSFANKRPAFTDSPFAMTRGIAGTGDWTPTVVDARSTTLAKAAAKVWSFHRWRAR